ncbi:MAG: hypothetical protein HY940_10320 [Gammaproteobacteria bacterium]|nr:hypothetical protein [Gammaproteobacteria bacterium]
MIIQRLLLLVLPALCSAAVHAATDERWYDVEVYIFQNLKQPETMSEIWSVDPGSPDYGNTVTLNRTPTATAVPFQRIGSDEMQLFATIKRLEGAQGYRSLVHLGWRQPVSDREQAQAVQIGHRPQLDNGDDSADETASAASKGRSVEGTIKLSAGNYLHLDLDLLFSVPLPVAADADAAGTTAPLPRDVYRLTQHRRIKSNELNYFDHPMFGALVMVRPHEVPEVAPKLPPTSGFRKQPLAR